MKNAPHQCLNQILSTTNQLASYVTESKCTCNIYLVTDYVTRIRRVAEEAGALIQPIENSPLPHRELRYISRVAGVLPQPKELCSTQSAVEAAF